MLQRAADAAPFRVLLVNLNDYDQPYPVYPVGLAYLDGALTNAGHVTRIWDPRLPGEGVEACATDFRPDLVALSLRNIDNVQAHNPRSFVQALVAMCGRLRQVTAAPLVLGGSGFSVFPRELFDLSGVEYAVSGEGEAALVQLVDALRRGGAPEGVAGLWLRRGKPPATVAPCAHPEAVFSTMPRHDAALLQAYVEQGSPPGVQTQRGCPLMCCYCTYPAIEGRRSRFRAPEETAEEFRRLASLGARYVFLVDSVFNTRPEHVAQTCEALIRADTGIEWECFLRPRGLTRELLETMKRAGLRHIEFGSDSFSDAVLDAYGKSFRFDDIRETSERAHAAGIRYSHFIIFGGPGETPATVEETIQRAETLPSAYYFATIGMRIYPHTPLWNSGGPGEGLRPAEFLVEPRFHLEPPFTVESLLERLRRLQRTSSNWAVGDPPPIFVETMAKLRKRGIRGPMWEYAELLQRFQAAS